jgi:hypothetical protein
MNAAMVDPHIDSPAAWAGSTVAQDEGRPVLDREPPGHDRRFHFEAGKMQLLNNRRIAHKRTGFRDWPEPERKRHLVRLWLRDRGRAFSHG